jgi:hypothetical protein
VLSALGTALPRNTPVSFDRLVGAGHFRGERRQAIVVTIRPAIFDCDVAALDEAGLVAAPRNAAKKGACSSADEESRNPITGIAGCCAFAASGHAAAAPAHCLDEVASPQFGPLSH